MSYVDRKKFEVRHSNCRNAHYDYYYQLQLELVVHYAKGEIYEKR